MAQVIQSQIVPADTGIVQTAMNNRQSMINNLIGLAPTMINTFMEIDQRTREVNAANDKKTYENLSARLAEMRNMPEYADGKSSIFAEAKKIETQLNRFERIGKFGEKLGLFGALEVGMNEARQGNPPTLQQIFDMAEGREPRTGMTGVQGNAAWQGNPMGAVGGPDDMKLSREVVLAETALTPEETAKLQNETGYNKAFENYASLQQQYENHPLKGELKTEAEKKRIALAEEINIVRDQYRQLYRGGNPSPEAKAALDKLQGLQSAYQNIDKQIKEVDELQNKYFGDAHLQYKEASAKYEQMVKQATDNKLKEIQTLRQMSDPKQAEAMLYGFSPEFIRANFGDFIDPDEERTIRNMAQEARDPAMILRRAQYAGAQGMTALDVEVANDLKSQLEQQLPAYEQQFPELAEKIKGILKLDDAYEILMAVNQLNEDRKGSQQSGSAMAEAGSEGTPGSSTAATVVDNRQALVNSGVNAPVSVTTDTPELTLSLNKGLDPKTPPPGKAGHVKGTMPQEEGRWKAAVDTANTKFAPLFVEQFMPAVADPKRQQEISNELNKVSSMLGSTESTAWKNLPPERKALIANTLKGLGFSAGSNTPDEVIEAFAARKNVIAHNAAVRVYNNPGDGLVTLKNPDGQSSTLYAPNIISGDIKPVGPAKVEPVKVPEAPILQLSLDGAIKFDTKIGTDMQSLAKANELIALQSNGKELNPMEAKFVEATLKGTTLVPAEMFRINPQAKLNVPGMGEMTAAQYMEKTRVTSDQIQQVYNRLNGRNVSYEQLLADPTIMSNEALYEKLSDQQKRFMDMNKAAQDMVKAGFELKADLMRNGVDVANLAETQRWHDVLEKDMQIKQQQDMLRIAIEQSKSGSGNAMAEMMKMYTQASTVNAQTTGLIDNYQKNFVNLYNAWLTTRGPFMDKSMELYRKENPAGETAYQNWQNALKNSVMTNAMLSNVGRMLGIEAPAGTAGNAPSNQAPTSNTIGQQGNSYLSKFD